MQMVDYIRTDTCGRGFQAGDYFHLMSVGFEDAQTDHRQLNEHYTFLALVYVIRGKAKFTAPNGRVYTVGSGDLFIREPYTIHSLEVAPDAQWGECFIGTAIYQPHSVAVHQRMANQLREEGWFNYTILKADEVTDHALAAIRGYELIDFSQPVIHLGMKPRLLVQLNRLKAQLRTATAETIAALQFEGLQVIAELFRTYQEEQRQVARQSPEVSLACEILSEQILASQTIPDLLEPVNCSYSNLRKKFVAEMGVTPGEFQISERIQHACCQLLTTDISIKELAAELGYANQFTFSRQFKQIIGMAPAHYRVNALNKRSTLG